MEWSQIVATAPTALSSVLFLAMHGTFFLSTSSRNLRSLPSVKPWVSILKPLSGLDDGLAENLASFASIDYPALELLLGVSSLDDPAVPVVRAVLAKYPSVSARLVVTAPPSASVPNPKVAQLMVLSKAAKGSVLVVSDANVRVDRSYLQHLVAELLQPGVGVVSSLIVGRGERSLGAAIDNAHLGAFIAPVIVFASRWLGHTVCVGKSMAMRRADLDRVGGFASVGGVLAEDDLLARRFDALGYAVRLSFCPVENRTVHASLAATVERHARWTRMRKSIEPRAYALELLLSPALMAAIMLVVVPTSASLTLLAAALGLQALGAAASLSRLRSNVWGLAALEPLRLLTYGVAWLLAGLSKRVLWRGRSYDLGRGSLLLPRAEPGRRSPKMLDAA